MIQKTLAKLGEAQEKYPVLILLGLLTLTLFLGYYAVQLETDASFDTMYREDSRTTVFDNLVSSEFGSTETLFIYVELDESTSSKERINDIRDPRVFESILNLAESLLEEPTVDEIVSAPGLIHSETGSLPATLEENKAIVTQFEEEFQYLISRDYNAANMIVAIDVPNKPGSIERIEEILNAKIAEAEKPLGVKMTLTGEPTLINRIMHLLINDNLVTVGIALTFVFILLWIFFRSPKIAIVAIQPVILTLIWLAGTLTLLGIRINMMTAAVGAMMVGMGIDYSIHMAHTYHENVHKGKKDAGKRTVRGVGSALFASAATTTAGFLAMLFGVSPSSQIQGTVLAIGIVYAFLTTLLALPCLLVIQRRILYSPLQELLFSVSKGEKKEERIGLAKRLLARLGKLQAKRPWLMIAGVVVFTVVLVPGLSQVYMDTDNENWIPEGDPVIEALNNVGNTFGGTDQMNLLVMLDDETPAEYVDLRHPDVLRKVAYLDSVLEELDYVNNVNSPTDILGTDGIPSTLEEVKALDNARFDGFFNGDNSIIRLTMTSDQFAKPGTNEDVIVYSEILSEIETINFPEGVRVEPQGGIAEFIELTSLLQADTGKTTLIGFMFVILIATLLYGSLVVGFLSFIPIIFSMIWAVSAMGYIGLPFTVLTSGMLAIVMGMGIDFSIHLVHSTKEWLKEGNSIEDSIVHALTGTGEAIFVSTVTTITGFLSLALASLLVTQRLGYTLAIAIFMSFVACMVIVPATLTIEHRLKGGRKK